MRSDGPKGCGGKPDRQHKSADKQFAQVLKVRHVALQQKAHRHEGKLATE